MIFPPESACAVELDRLAKSYRVSWTGRRLPALRGVSLRLASGQVLGLLGPNGSGKSTTLKLLAGLMTPDAGAARIHGHPAGSAAARALVGYLPESLAFAPHLTGREWLAACAALSDLNAEAAARRIESVLAWTGLAAMADQRLAACSKGMRQRLGLAAAVVHGPRVVLLDEPAAGLDPVGRVALGRLIGELAAEGRTVLFSSHLLEHAAGLCDRIALLAQGRLIAEGTPAELLGVQPGFEPGLSAVERLYLERINA